MSKKNVAYQSATQFAIGHPNQDEDGSVIYR